MNENGSKRREWVKTAAIIFLSVLLVLTFFSNTIMNYSLPEVAAQYMESGTVTAKIRGTGVVESGDPYEVKIEATRTIRSVKVEEGDFVEEGDILFALADEEDENLQAARDELESAEKEYELAVKTLELDYLIGNISEEVYNIIENGTVTSFEEYKKRMDDIEAKIEEYQKSKDDLTATQTNLQYSTPDTTKEQKEYNKAKDAYDELSKDLEEMEGDLESMETDLKDAQDYISDVDDGYITVSGGDAEEKLKVAKKKVKQLPKDIKALKKDIKDLKEEVYDAEVEMNSKQKALDDKTDNTASKNSVEIQLADAESKYEDAVEERNKLIESIQAEYGTSYDLDTPYEAVLKAREKVNELEAEAIGATIEAPISGTISSIEVVAGDKTGDGLVLATMQPEGKGYTMSFSVTNEQAKRLSVGDVAELVNSWRYDNVEVVLKSIKPDQENPGENKMLTFDVKGDVTAGQTLNISVGQKSAEYDMIVPNGAIREDNNGKFVLIVESKSSPLGNRYYATRADIQVLASDDSKSAVSGTLYGHEFVITTSTQPVEAGQLVRLAEN